ncbi:ribonuclease H-like domain-containing protein [Aspergillus keveii]|uniref:Ribonuclease H-like domain-containing protein n=1 Tax=Aspergillus keveii TaxID=714993 RepID=A0ABR4GHS2_9EURO
MPSTTTTYTPTTTTLTTTTGPKDKHETIFDALSTKCHSTATLASNQYQIGTPTAPPPSPQGTKKHSAIAIDCEMVGIDPRNTAYLGQVVAIDILTEKTALDICVQPPVTVRNWRKQSSGLSPAVFREYRNRGKLVSEVRGAQKALFNLIDSETILVGHALQNDLKALGIVHGRVVNTQILTKELVGEIAGIFPNRTWGLKGLAREILGRDIQMGKGHDCAEDTLATRDLVLACVRDKGVKEWAQGEASCPRNFPSSKWENEQEGMLDGDSNDVESWL